MVMTRSLHRLAMEQVGLDTEAEVQQQSSMPQVSSQPAASFFEDDDTIEEEVEVTTPTEGDGKKGKKKSRDDDEHTLEIPKHFQVELLAQTMDRLRVSRQTPPPHIPLCRIYRHDSVRQVGPRRSTLKTTFLLDGYLEEKGSFVLSFKGASGVDIPVTEDIMASWDPLWKEVNNKFEESLDSNPDWVDFKNRMFLCWDGNHRLQAWMEAIQENFRFDLGKHILVKASFIHVGIADELPLIGALNRLNRLNEEAFVKTELKDILYSVRKLGEADDSFFASKLTPEDLEHVAAAREAELKRNGTLPWYPLTRYMLARILFAQDIERDLQTEREKAMAKGDIGETILQRPDILVRRRHSNYMGKLLGVVDPKNGDKWFQMVTTKTSQDKRFHMTLEKLHHLRRADLPNETKCRLLSLSLAGEATRTQHGIPQGDKDYRIWVGKEVFYEHIYQRSAELIDSICLQDPTG